MKSSCWILVVFLLAAVARAAPGGDELDLRLSLTAENELRRGDHPLGDTSVSALYFRWSRPLPLEAAPWRATSAVRWTRFGFGDRGALPLPATVHEAAVDFTFMRPLSPQWTLIASVQPGVYGDLKGDLGKAINAPALVLATYATRPELAWTFGVRIDAFSDNPAIPILGVRWDFAPGWKFSVGLPRTGFTWQYSETLELAAFAAVQSGSFRVTVDGPPTLPRIGRTYLDYREIRAGVGASLQLRPTIRLILEAGMVTDQKFEYHDRNLTLNGDTAAFGTVGVSAKF